MPRSASSRLPGGWLIFVGFVGFVGTSSALKLAPAGLLCRRAALHAAATAALSCTTNAFASAADSPVMNQAEQKLQEILASRVAEQEKALGFKFERDDITQIEELLRNKYCGKAGLFGAMEGGTCTENVITAAYCSGDQTYRSSSAGCPQVKPPRPPDKPPTAPTLPSLPSLPF